MNNTHKFQKIIILSIIFILFFNNAVYASIHNSLTNSKKIESALPSEKPAAAELTNPWTLVPVENKGMNLKVYGFSVKGEIPTVNAFAGYDVQNEANGYFSSEVNKYLDTAPDSVKRVEFSCEYKTDGKYITLILNASYHFGGMNPSQYFISTVCVNNQTKKIIRLDELLGKNSIKIANKGLLSEIKANPSKYNSKFSGIKEDQNFYCESNSVFLVFDTSEIAPISEGIVEFRMNYVEDYVVEKSEYYLTSGFNIKMVKLRQVSAQFGYTLGWDSENREIEIIEGSLVVARLRLGRNSYTKGNNTVKTLEAAPELKKDATYVPISFFEEMLEIYYYVHDNGTISFSKYIPYAPED